MVPHVGGGPGREEITARRLEECEDRAVLKGRRIRDIDNDIGTSKRLIEALARDRVDARAGGGLQHVVAFLAEPARQLRADQTGPANDDNFHDFPSFFRPPMAMLLHAAGRCARTGGKALQPD